MLLNKSSTIKYILETVKETRSHKFSQVSAETLNYLEGILRVSINGIIRSHPSKGKTIYPPIR